MENLNEILHKLCQLAKAEPIPSIIKGDTAVGLTLLHALEIPYSSVSKPMYKGIVVNASRKGHRNSTNRVNLFAQVPDWEISFYKSSAELLNNHGYFDQKNRHRLFCTVSGRSPNSQGLFLQVAPSEDLINEVFRKDNKQCPVVSWRISKLLDRLNQTHPESLWVTATVFERDNQEFFHYRDVTYTGPPSTDIFPDLLDSGTITIDHLIQAKEGKVTEKGPLFKIHPDNFSLLFPISRKYDLLTLNL